jgi:DNA-binding transcriptional LysR family regulator
MRLRDLEIIWSVARHRTMREAAVALAVSQPAVSKALRHAEDMLGFALFLREGRRLVPTPELQALMPEIERAFATVEEIRRRAAGMQRSQTGELTIASIPTLTGRSLAEAVMKFRRRHPRVLLRLVTLPTPDVIARVRDGPADIGLLHGPVTLDELQAVRLGTNVIVAVLPRSHPLASRPAVHPRDLRNYEVITIGRATAPGSLILAGFERATVPVTVAVEVTTSASAVMLVRAGVGVAVVDGKALENIAVDEVVVRPFLPEITLSVDAITSAARPVSRAASAFLRILERESGFDATGARRRTAQPSVVG